MNTLFLIFVKMQLTLTILIALITSLVFFLAEKSNLTSSVLFFITSLFLFFNLFFSVNKKLPELLIILNFFFFLGFSFKPFIHVVFNYDFLEPAGLQPWLYLQKALFYSSTISLLMCGFNFIVHKYVPKKMSELKSESQIKSKSNILFFSATAFSCGVYFLNMQLSFLRVGLAAQTHIVFPFSLLFSWLLGLGCVFILFALIKIFNRSIVVQLGIVLVLAMLSLMSRSVILLMIYPCVVYVIKNNHIKFKLEHFLKVTAGIVLFLSLIVASTLLRKAYFSTDNMTLAKVADQLLINIKTGGNINSDFSNENKPKLSDIKATDLILDSQIVHQIQNLVLERWIGFEGLLVAAESSSDESFFTFVNETSQNNPISIYSKLSANQMKNTSSYLFATFPGPWGLVFLGSSFYLRLISILLFLSILYFFIFFSEKYFYGLNKSVVCWWLGSALAQVSLYLKHNLIIIIVYFVMCILTIEIIKKYEGLYD